MLLAIVFAYLAYKRASDSGRNGIVWAIIAVVTFIGTQILVGLAAALVLVFVALALSWPETHINDYEILLNIIGIIAGIGAGSLVIWYLGRVPEADTNINSPPPPPKFDDN